MVVDWLKLSGVLVLLLTPIALFHGKRVRYRDVHRDWEGYWLRTFSLGLHTIDFGRALLGTWWLTEVFTLTPASTGILRQVPLASQTLVLLLATALQTLVCKERDAGHAPFAFVGGLVCGYLPPLIVAFALPLALVVTLGARLQAIFFPLLAVSIVAIGIFLTGNKYRVTLIVTAAAAAMPWLLCLLFPRQLMATYLGRRGGSLPPKR